MLPVNQKIAFAAQGEEMSRTNGLGYPLLHVILVGGYI